MKLNKENKNRLYTEAKVANEQIEKHEKAAESFEELIKVKGDSEDLDVKPLREKVALEREKSKQIRKNMRDR
jgi:hypothetical protein